MAIIAALPVFIGIILGIVLRIQGISAEQGQFYSMPTVSLFLLITVPFSLTTLIFGLASLKAEKKKDSLIAGIFLLAFLILVIASLSLINSEVAFLFYSSLLIPFIVLIFSIYKLIKIFKEK